MSDADAAQRGESKQLIDSRWKQKDQAADDDVLPTLLSGLKVVAVDDQQDTRDLIIARADEIRRRREGQRFGDRGTRDDR